jgi:hypothetical protein
VTARLASAPVPAHIRMHGTRGPVLRDPEPYWIPARFVHAPQVCDFCGLTIPVGSPGSRTGERGTRAYFNSLLKVWECMDCRQEALRAHAACLPSHPNHERRAA